MKISEEEKEQLKEAQGGTITINGNCALADNVTEQINDVNTTLSAKTNSATKSISADTFDDFLINSIWEFITNVNAHKTFIIDSGWAGMGYYGIVLFVIDQTLAYGFATNGLSGGSYSFQLQPGKPLVKNSLG